MKRKLAAFGVLIALAIGTFVIATPAYAVGDADLSVETVVDLGGTSLRANICDAGGTVEQIDFDYSAPGLTLDSFVINPIDSAATDNGSINPTTGVWTGTLADTECITINVLFEIPAAGTVVNGTVSVASSLLDGGATNVDPDSSNNSDAIDPITIAQRPDLAIAARLVTPGEIENGKEISYEVTVSNVGDGDETNSAGNFLIAFLVPPDVTFNEFVDADLDDSVDVDTSSCITVPISATPFAPALTEYADYSDVYCNFSLNAPLASGESATFTANLTATSAFTSNSTAVITVVEGSDVDTLSLAKRLLKGLAPDITDLNNNFLALVYNNDPLQVTINRCAGTDAVVTVDDACFTVHFSKPIYAPSFTVNDLVLSGGGSVSSFVQNSATTWTVHVTGMTAGGTLALTLGADSVVDLSAINNDVHVLGENTVRFEVPGSASGNSASGTLAVTGSKSDPLTAILLIALGLLLVAAAGKKSRVSEFAEMSVK
jgi:hypothetical protein